MSSFNNQEKIIANMKSGNYHAKLILEALMPLVLHVSQRGYFYT